MLREVQGVDAGLEKHGVEFLGEGSQFCDNFRGQRLGLHVRALDRNVQLLALLLRSASL